MVELNYALLKLPIRPQLTLFFNKFLLGHSNFSALVCKLIYSVYLFGSRFEIQLLLNNKLKCDLTNSLVDLILAFFWKQIWVLKAINRLLRTFIPILLFRPFYQIFIEVLFAVFHLVESNFK